MSMHSVDITQENAQQYIIEESQKRLVLVDFWAEWCEPCKTLAPVLEKLVNEYDGQFLLAKIDAEAQQGLAAQFGVRSLPTLMIVKGGQPVDGFAGAQPEPEIRALLDKYLPKPWDIQLEKARALMADGNLGAALPELHSAFDSSDQRVDITFAYARCLLGLHRLDESAAVLAQVKMVDQDAEYAQLTAQLELAREAGKSPEIEALEAELALSPEDQGLGLKLAVQYAQNNHVKEALELLLVMLQKDLGAAEGEVKKAYTDILQSLEKGDTLAAEYQRKLYTLLY